MATASSSKIDDKSIPVQETQDEDDIGDVVSISHLHRKLNHRQIQLIAIGGSIGTGLFVSIGYGLIEGGPGSLFIAFTMYSIWLASVNNSMAEMATFMPVAGGWVRMATHWVDEAFGFMLGWNFLLYELCLIPFEISALNLVLTFWRDDIPVWAVCLACTILYGLLNIFAVKWYGESEFWLASGKVLLILIVFCFTFITMVGGNPKHDAYGFRYWRDPGSFAEYVTTGSLGRFQGYLAALFQAAFTIVGPEYLSMVAGEAINPRKTIKSAFKTTYMRYGIFFIGGALCCGIVTPYNDAGLIAKLNGDGSGTGAASPYVVAMSNLGITVLPDITNALLVTSIFSAGNSYVYCSMRSLYAMSIDGHAPQFFTKCNKNGVPIYAFVVPMLFSLLSFLSISSGSAKVITWLANLTQASQMINYIGMSVVYLFFYRALKVQGIPRETLPYRGYWQPFCGWFGLCAMVFTVIMYGYTTFLPGWWNTGTFFSYYTMIFVAIVTYSGWKFIKKSKLVKAHEADLVWERPLIDAYEASLVGDLSKGFWDDCAKDLGLRKRRHVVEDSIEMNSMGS
ncbi:putative amino acid permease, partial [Aureobasidium melanogenum]